jgi:hypothetical protein
MNTRQRWIVIGSTAVVAGLGIGCGNGDEQSTAQTGYHDANVVAQASVRPSEMKSEAQNAVVSPASTPLVAEAKPELENAPKDTETANVLPPDVLAKVSKSIVTRGETVDVIAEGSSDVVEMVLSDDFGTTQSLVFDAGTGTWRASYRVPLKAHDDRLGLAIRARNGADHWRRVYVFLTLPENSTKADSTG